MNEKIRKAYEKVFRDILLRGPKMFIGKYDRLNGSEEFMDGIQTVMEYIVMKSFGEGSEAIDIFNAMFFNNMNE